MIDPSALAGWVYFCVVVGVAVALWVIATNHGYQKGYTAGYVQASKDHERRKR